MSCNGKYLCPIHAEDGKWYFWDETWASKVGPFETEEEVKKALAEYVERILG